MGTHYWVGKKPPRLEFDNFIEIFPFAFIIFCSNFVYLY